MKEIQIVVIVIGSFILTKGSSANLFFTAGVIEMKPFSLQRKTTMEVQLCAIWKNSNVIPCSQPLHQQEKPENELPLPPVPVETKPPYNPMIEKAERQQERADVVMEYEWNNHISFRKPSTKAKSNYGEEEVKKIIPSLHTKKAMAVIILGKLANYEMSKAERVRRMDEIETWFRLNGFKKVVFHQAYSQGWIILRERSFGKKITKPNPSIGMKNLPELHAVLQP